MDWETLERTALELDPELVERIRSREKLTPISIRVGAEQIAEARRVATETGVPYQAVLRGWLARGASLARSQRRRTETAVRSRRSSR